MVWRFFLRVCHVWERFWPIEIGGLERYILWLSTYLAKKQAIDFSLITGRTKLTWIPRKIKKFEDSGFLKVYRLGPNPVDVLNGAYLYASHSITPPMLLQKMKFTSLYKEAAKLECAKSADVFHIHGIWSDLEYIDLGIYLSRRFGKPLVLTLHGGFVGSPVLGGMPLDSPHIKAILENDVSAITTYSKEILGALDGLGLGKKSHLVTNFVNASKFKNQNPSKPHDLTMIYVGRFEPLQTPDLVIKAFKRVHDEMPNAKLIMVGYGRMNETLKLLIKELNLEDSVNMAGRQTDVRNFLWSSDVFVATNFGYIATLEAWAAGLAVVAPKFGIMKETISHEENGLLFEPLNVDDLASNLLRIIKDDKLRRKLALNGAQTVREYDIGAVAPKLSAIYQQVTNQ